MTTSSLVFGGSGFLGRHLVSRLKQWGTDVMAPTRSQFNLMGTGYLEEMIVDKFDYIFLCTNWFRPGNFNVSADEFIINNIINFNALRYWKAHQPQATLVTFGSDAAYDPKEYPIEQNYLTGFPGPSYYSYGLTKRFLYQGQQEIHKQTQSSYLHFPLISLFGTKFDLEDDHLMHSIVRKIIHAKMLNERAEFWGDGSQIREVCFVDDVVENVLQLTLIQKERNDIFNLGSEKKYSVRSLVEHVCQLLQYDINDVIFDSSKTVGSDSKSLNSQKAIYALQDSPYQYKDTRMMECIQKVARYYCQSKFPNC